jgi:hypothetical protein
MSQEDPKPCNYCEIGYHMPFDRFEEVAVIRDGPAFLKRCKLCGTLWFETLRDAARVTRTKALELFPDAQI